MGQATVQIQVERDRQIAASYVAKAPIGTFIRFKRNKRSVDQNSRMWAMLTAISMQIVWVNDNYVHVDSVDLELREYVMRYSPDDWKDYFCHALRKARWMPTDDGQMIPLSLRTSEMDKEEHSDLTTLIEKFGDSRGVDFGEPEKERAA